MLTYSSWYALVLLLLGFRGCSLHRTAKDLSQNNTLNIGKELTIHETPVARRRKVILLGWYHHVLARFYPLVKGNKGCKAPGEDGTSIMRGGGNPFETLQK